MPNLVVAPTMDDLWVKANDTIIWGTRDDLSYFSSLDAMVSDCMGVAESATYSLDMGVDLWLTPVRWTMLIRQYLDPDALDKFSSQVAEVGHDRGIVAMDMQGVEKTVVASNARASRRKHGGCMRMVTYRAFPQPTVTLFSRTSYLGYIGGLDMLCAYKLIELACDSLDDGTTPDDFKFVWMCDTWQFHGFKSFAYIFESGQDKYLRLSDKSWERHIGDTYTVNGVKRTILPLAELPTWKLLRYWWKRIEKQDREGKLYGDMKYGAEKRIRRRIHSQTGIDQSPYLGKENAYRALSTPIDKVDFSNLRRKR